MLSEFVLHRSIWVHSGYKLVYQDIWAGTAKIRPFPQDAPQRFETRRFCVL
jgi:hypothetical protein